MKKTYFSILFCITFFLNFQVADAISFGTTTSTYTTAGDTNLTIGVEKDDLIICFSSDDEITNINSAYVDSEPMQENNSVISSFDRFKLFSFTHFATSTGLKELSFSRSTSNPSSNWWIHCATYKDVSQSIDIVSATLSNNSGTSHQGEIFNDFTQSWNVLYGLADSGGVASSTNSILRGAILNTASALFDNGGISTGRGSSTMSFLSNNGEATGIIISLAPKGIRFSTSTEIYSVGSTANLTLTVEEPQETLLCFSSDDEVTNENIGSIVSDSLMLEELTNINSYSNYFRLFSFRLFDVPTGSKTISFSRSTSNPSSNWWIHCATYKGAQNETSYNLVANKRSSATGMSMHMPVHSLGSVAVMYGLADSGGMASSTNAVLRGSILNTASAMFESATTINSLDDYLMRFVTNSGESTSIGVVLPPRP